MLGAFHNWAVVVNLELTRQLAKRTIQHRITSKKFFSLLNAPHVRTRKNTMKNNVMKVFKMSKEIVKKYK